MENDEARLLLRAERARVEELLASTVAAAAEDRSSGNGETAASDAAESLSAEGVDDAVVARLRARLAAVGRAEARLRDGTYGRSRISGDLIPDGRLEAEPTAETTVEEAEDRR